MNAFTSAGFGIVNDGGENTGAEGSNFDAEGFKDIVELEFEG